MHPVLMLVLGLLALGVAPALACPKHDDVKASFVTRPTLTQGEEATVAFALTTRDSKPVTPDRLAVVHTQRIHALIVDTTLNDYQHIHPEPSATPGTYAFAFTPRTAHDYRVWLDITPIKGSQCLQRLTLKGAAPVKGGVDTTESLGPITVDGITAMLKLDSPLVAGEPTMATVHLWHGDEPVHDLEPTMEAFAHAVGFSADGSSVMHAHPMGEEPTDDASRGGPDLRLHLEPLRAGFMRLFVQIKVEGHTLFLPFGLTVQPRSEKTPLEHHHHHDHHQEEP